MEDSDEDCSMECLRISSDRMMMKELMDWINNSMSRVEVHNLCYCQIFILDGWWTNKCFDDVATSVIEEGNRCRISIGRCRWLTVPTATVTVMVSWFGSKKVVEDDHHRRTDRSKMTDRTSLCLRQTEEVEEDPTDSSRESPRSSSDSWVFMEPSSFLHSCCAHLWCQCASRWFYLPLFDDDYGWWHLVSIVHYLLQPIPTITTITAAIVDEMVDNNTDNTMTLWPRT